MGYLLDTDIVSDLVRHPDGRVARRIREVGEPQVRTSVIVAAELRFGAAKKASRRLTAQLEDVLDAISILPFEPPADRTYGMLRSELEWAGRTIGGNDLLIAAHALTVGDVLVTANQREFQRVERLVCENWLQEPPFLQPRRNDDTAS